MWTAMHEEAVRDFYEYKCPSCLSVEGMIHEDECAFRFVGNLSWLLGVLTLGGPQCSDCGFWIMTHDMAFSPFDTRCRRCRMKCDHCGELDPNIMQHVVEVKSAKGGREHTIFRLCGDCSAIVEAGKHHDMVDALSLREAN